MSGTDQSKWVGPAAIGIALIGAWFLYDSLTRDRTEDVSPPASSSVDSSHE